MTQDILITPGSGEPQILFRGSGTTDTSLELNVVSSYQSATGSGTALLFEGEQGLLFGITDNLSSGTIFSVSDITGLPIIEVDASGDVKLGEFGRDIIAYQPLTLESGVPSVTTDKLYNDGGTLKFNGSAIGGGGVNFFAGSGLTLEGSGLHVYGGGGHFVSITLESGVPSDTTDKLYNDGYFPKFNGSGIPVSHPVTNASGVNNMMIISQSDYDGISTKDPNTLYFIT